MLRIVKKLYNEGYLKAISWVVIFTLIGKALGFFRQWTLSYYYGASGISDAYLISQTIPGTLFQLVGSGLLTCYIPIYIKIRTDISEKESNVFTSRMLNLICVFSTIIILLIWLFTPFFVRIFAIGFQGETLYYACWFTRISALSLYFSSLVYVYNAFLQANECISYSTASVIPNNIAIIVSIVLAHKYNLWILSIGTCLAIGIQLLFLLPKVAKLGYRYSFDFRFNDKHIREFFRMLAPILVGVSASEINVLIDRTIASAVSEGGISSLNYSNSIIQMVHGVIVMSIIGVFYPKMISRSRKLELLKKQIIMVSAVLIPITLIFIFASGFIVEMLFGYGASTGMAIQMTSLSLKMYSVGICFLGIRECIYRYYYAIENTKIPMVNSIIGVVLNIILNLILPRLMGGVHGLALATSISAIVTVVLLLLQMRFNCYLGDKTND